MVNNARNFELDECGFVQSVCTRQSTAVFVFDVRMLKYLDGAYASYRARVEHFYQQIHEDGILVETIAVVLL